MVQHLVLSFFSSATGRDTPSYVKIITRYVPRVKGAGPDAGKRGEGLSYYKRRIQEEGYKKTRRRKPGPGAEFKRLYIF